MSDLQQRYDRLGHAGAYDVYTPFRTLHDNHETFMDPKEVPLNRNAIHDHMGGMMQSLSAPFAQSSYGMNPGEDDRVYVGTYVDPATGIENHLWEEPMIHPETDESLQPSNDAMERLFEAHSGGLNNWAEQKRLGVPDHKPEDNIMESMNNKEDFVRKQFGDWDVLRQYAERRAREEGNRKPQHNYEGIHEKANGPGGSFGLHHLGYTKDYNHMPISGQELSDRGVKANATAQVQLAGAWAKPTQYVRNENNMNWQPSGIAGHTFAMRDVNEFPGDKEAHKYQSQMMNLKPIVNVVLS